MNPILLAVLSVVVIGIICAVMLAVASKVMAVKTEERMVRLRAALPGANCGGAATPAATATPRALGRLGRADEPVHSGRRYVSRELSDILGVGFQTSSRRWPSCTAAGITRPRPRR
jgi:Na+-translocating ferredoxin:NAD+ oxidoreductase RNF subunit RnfB